MIESFFTWIGSLISNNAGLTVMGIVAAVVAFIGREKIMVWYKALRQKEADVIPGDTDLEKLLLLSQDRLFELLLKWLEDQGVPKSEIETVKLIDVPVVAAKARQRKAMQKFGLIPDAPVNPEPPKTA